MPSKKYMEKIFNNFLYIIRRKQLEINFTWKLFIEKFHKIILKFIELCSDWNYQEIIISHHFIGVIQNPKTHCCIVIEKKSYHFNQTYQCCSFFFWILLPPNGNNFQRFWISVVIYEKKNAKVYRFLEFWNIDGNPRIRNI